MIEIRVGKDDNGDGIAVREDSCSPKIEICYPYNGDRLFLTKSEAKALGTALIELASNKER